MAQLYAISDPESDPKWPLQELLFQPGEPVLSGFDFDFNEIL